MAAKLKHVAIVSNEHERILTFYEMLFGMERDRTVTTTDGYIGMNVNPRAPGRQAGLDHFGFEVDDVEEVFARLHEHYPSIEVLKRPNNRPFAGISTHDPLGNVFDLSQAGMENRRGVYADAPGTEQQHPRHIKHLMLRTVDPGLLARFYRDVFDLREEEKPADDPNHYLTDGTVTFVIAPWRISSFAGSGIERPALDHLGFEVESLDAFQRDLQHLAARHSELAPRVKEGPEGTTRLQLLSTCRYGELELSDPDGVLIDVSEAKR